MKDTIFPSINEALLDKIKSYNDILIIGHKNPDGDCLSSTLAVEAILKKLNKNTLAISDGPFHRPELKFLSDKVKTEINPEFLSRKPLVIVVDCSTIDRPGEIFKSIEHLERVVIDHHSSGEAFCKEELSYIVPFSPSTTLLVDMLRESLSIELDKEIATYLYIGLLTDTGFFHFISQRVGEEVFKRAAEFSKAGVDPYDMYDKMNDGKAFEDVLNGAKVLESTETYYEGKLLVAYQKKEIETAGLSDNLYAELLKISGVKAVVFFKEKEDVVDVGFRAKKDSGLDVGEIASLIGGGGHKLASGASLKLPLDKCKEKVLALFTSIL